MKTILTIAAGVLLLMGCGSSENPDDQDSATDSAEVRVTDTRSLWGSDAIKLTSHLKDTVAIDGDCILFLRPDFERLVSYSEIDSTIKNVDGDFANAVTGTHDSLVANTKYEKLKMEISVFRYVKILDCKGGPVVLDRDSVNYGYVMSSPGKNFISSSTIHSGNYLGEIENYFKLKP